MKNKKSKLVVFGILLLSLAANAAEIVPIKFSWMAPWKKNIGKEQIFEIDYPGKKWPFLNVHFPAKANTFYRLTYEGKSNNPKQILLVTGFGNKEKNLTTLDYTKYFAYFYSEKTNSKGTVSLYLNPEPGSAKISVRKLKIESLTASDLKGNFILYGDLEDGAAPQSIFSNPWNRPFQIRLVKSPNFLSGTKSLMFPGSKEKNVIISTHFPMIPGKNVELKFWAKADRPAPISANIDCWTAGHKKHHYFTKEFQVSTDWQLFSATYKVPSLETEPALKSHLLRLQFGSKASSPNIYLDNISYSFKE